MSARDEQVAKLREALARSTALLEDAKGNVEQDWLRGRQPSDHRLMVAIDEQCFENDKLAALSAGKED